ncbi:MAG: NAD-dependent epimerase/dehydratase family protein [Candidatus Dadabacteria bacterium]|nr:MAG: NAD-dependent epimerase/dehydratase family protein [Candidatus Dadabacteria bacterium]
MTPGRDLDEILGDFEESGYRLLIIGASSFIGRGFLSHLSQRAVLGTFNSTPFEGGVHFDAQTDDLPSVLSSLSEFSHALILFGIATPDECARNPDRAYQLNVISSKKVIDSLVQHGVMPIFASSEAVFDGSKGMYTEDDPPTPILIYGRHKVEVEQYLREQEVPYLILRLARVFGTEPNDGTLLTGMVDLLAQNADIKCAEDQIMSPIHIDEVVAITLALCLAEKRGTFHLAGPEALSRYEVLMHILREYTKFAKYTGKISKVPLSSFKTEEKRPLNTSLSPARALEATGFRLKGIREWSAVALSKWRKHVENKA